MQTMRIKITFAWIDDSGASSHMMNNLDVAFNLEDINVIVMLIDGCIVKAAKKVKFKGVVKQTDGKETQVTFDDKYVPALY
jgi:hypothetical protein